jgi:hypothetical protein
MICHSRIGKLQHCLQVTIYDEIPWRPGFCKRSREKSDRHLSVLLHRGRGDSCMYWRRWDACLRQLDLAAGGVLADPVSELAHTSLGIWNARGSARENPPSRRHRPLNRDAAQPVAQISTVARRAQPG